MSILIKGATVIDGVSERPIEGQSIWIESGRIRAVDHSAALEAVEGVDILDARGKFVIPGLMNANVHLLMDVRLENLARFVGRYEDLIAEAAQIALKNGITTVFDTAGPRRALIATRERINRGELIGSRIFCAGWIVGLDGPFSQDFYAKVPEIASAAIVNRVNATWVENVGRHLMWLTPEGVAKEVGDYLEKGIDFLKYASNDHSPGAFLAFSPKVQEKIVATTHAAGLTAQAHTMSVEGLRIAVEAGCDIIQHANITGPVPIPDGTLGELTARKTGAVVFPFTQKRLEWIMANASDRGRTMMHASDENVRRLIGCGARLLMANDGGIFAQEMAVDPVLTKSWAAPGEDNLNDLGTGHFAWFKAMEEKGCSPMDMLRAATINIATAYGRNADLGSLEPGKIADILILHKNPLEAAANYRSIDKVIKGGQVVDRNALPIDPVLTRALDPLCEEELSYISFFHAGRYPVCPACDGH